MQDENELDARAIARLQRLGGGRLLRQMIHLFVQQATATIATARVAFANADLPGVERAVHSLKSSAGNVGARAIQELAAAVERLAEQSEGEKIGPLLQDLEAAFQRLEPQLEQLKAGLEP